MAWVPILESEHGPNVSVTGATMDGDSVVSATTQPSSTSIALSVSGLEPSDGLQLRLTTQSYSAPTADESTGAGGGRFNYFDGSVAAELQNQAGNSGAPDYEYTEFDPSPAEVTAFDLSNPLWPLSFYPPQVENIYDYSVSILVEVWSDSPDPPAEVAPPYVVRGTHRAYMGTDSPQSAWIRDEAGQHDLTQYDEIVVELKGAGRDRPDLTLPATGTAEGKLEFTVTANGARKRLRPGSFNLFAKADGQVIYTGLLEVLA